MVDASHIQDRAAGAIMGAFIGDALGLGPHWYYDLTELRRDCGLCNSRIKEPAFPERIMEKRKESSRIVP